MLPKEWVEKLNNSIPASTAAPDFFMQCLKACEDYINEPSIANIPMIPSSATSSADRKIWIYVNNSVTHLHVDHLCPAVYPTNIMQSGKF